MRHSKSHKNHCDIAIVGAGVAGLYCAWRILRNKGNAKKVRIFEQESRIGGRLLSLDLLPVESRKAELGGMRFLTRHQLISALINDLRTEQPGAAAGLAQRDFTFNTTLLFLRAQKVLDATPHSIIPVVVPYALRDGASAPVRGLAVCVAKRGIREALNLILRDQSGEATACAVHTNTLLQEPELRKDALTSLQWLDWQETARIEGIPLSDIGFWNLMQRCLDPDEFLFLHDALGYESLVANSNAAQAIPVFLGDFDATQYWTLQGGMESIPQTLASCLKARDGGILSRRSTVRSIELLSNGGFKLVVQGGNHHTYFANQVITAIPQAALDKMHLVGFGEERTRRFQRNIQQVTSHPAFKMFLAYNAPWWTGEVGFTARAVTDLPIRQVYYLGDKDKPEAPAFVMASYSDDHYVDFWEPLVRDRTQPKHARDGHVATDRIMHKAHEQLERIHGRTLPQPVAGCVKRWPAAWHFWNVHTRPWAAAAKMVRPFQRVDFFTCGEAYSLEQGWVEGALKSAERVLKKLKVAAPNEIKTYDHYIES